MIDRATSRVAAKLAAFLFEDEDEEPG